MKKWISLLAMTASLATPAAALAGTVDASLIPDGTYVVKVQKVDDAQHVTVVMNNGIETTLSAAGSVSFAKIKSNDTIKVSVIKGKVPIFQLQ